MKRHQGGVGISRPKVPGTRLNMGSTSESYCQHHALWIPEHGSGRGRLSSFPSLGPESSVSKDSLTATHLGLSVDTGVYNMIGRKAKVLYLIFLAAVLCASRRGQDAECFI